MLQLSINALQPLDYHLALGARLSALRNRGVLILSSGNVVHNLRMVEWDKPASGADWAQRFDEAVRAQMVDDPSAILKLGEHPDFAQAVPTPNHYIPLLYTAGLAMVEGRSQSLIQGYSLGSLSMTSYNVGPDLHLPCEAQGVANLPADMPADQTNI